MKKVLSPSVSEREGKVKRILITVSSMKNAEAQAEELQNPRKQRSYHYIIDFDGSVVVGALETQRTWVAHNKRFDDESISILVCSNGYPDYKPSSEAMDALTALCADICTRYEITPVVGPFPYYDGTITPYFAGPYIREHVYAILTETISKMTKPKRTKKGGAKK